MKNIILDVKNLNKTYITGKNKNHVLKDVNLQLYDGDFTILMGGSGSGKSTLLNCISRLDNFDSGNVTFKSNDITKMNQKALASFRRKEIGFVFQQASLLYGISVLENVAIPAHLIGEKSKGEINNDVNTLLEKLGIDHIKNSISSQISGGEAQRVSIASALINNPDLLFADEPTGALNSKTSQDVLDIFTKLNEEGQSILTVTHDIKTAIRANRIIYLYDGVIADELVLPKYDGSDLDNRENQVISWLKGLGW